jgi:hypothetical protein
MYTRRVTVPTAPTNLFELMASQNPAHEYCQSIGIQARTTNVGIVEVGVGGGQPVQELVAGQSTEIGTNSPKSIFVRSTNGTEQINVSLTAGANG